MIKGVNKRIIEVNHPEDQYFEKVILFLSPKVKYEHLVVQQHVDEYLKVLAPKIKQKNERKRKLKPKWMLVFQLAAAAVGGGLIYGVIQML